MKPRDSQNNNKPAAYRRPEAADMLGLSLSTLDRAIARGDIAIFHYGARVLVTPEEIKRYLHKFRERKKARRKPPPAPRAAHKRRPAPKKPPPRPPRRRS
jgi:excisionase family DNA binding protein